MRQAALRRYSPEVAARSLQRRGLGSAPLLDGMGSQRALYTVGPLFHKRERKRKQAPVVDIVEIALDTITDFADFEKLACEVLYTNGFPEIHPLGGFRDSGQDAVSEKFYVQDGRRIRTVFQITTQETIESKLADTISSLDSRGVEYASLHLVTSRSLTTTRKTNLAKAARDSGVTLEITDRKVIALALSDFNNGLFSRHFPDPEAQIRIARQAQQPENITPERLLRMAMAFTSLPEADRARKQLLRELALALLVSSGTDGADLEALHATHGRLFPGATALQPEQFASALDFWVGEGFVTKSDVSHYRATQAGSERAAAAEVMWEQHKTSLVSDLADSVEEAVGSELDSKTRGLIERNGLDAITGIFRLFGLELASQLLGTVEARGGQVGSHEAIVETTEKGLPQPLGEVLTAALGELLARPNGEQAEALSAMALGYMGASLIEVDPAVRELQATRIREKTFVLDTDFLLDCIVAHQPRQRGSLALVRTLCSLGCRVIVPSVCVQEAADHAAIAQRTVGYFGQAIFGLSSQQASEKINNMFARGWYFKVQRDGDVTFESYLANYYERQSPYSFMEHVVNVTLPDEVEVGDIDTLLKVEFDHYRVESLTEALIFFLQRSRKSEYRDESEIESLARTDARLHSAVAEAARVGDGGGKGALIRGCYLITSSTRFIRAAERAFGEADEVSARPDTLTGLLQVVGRVDVTPREFMALFDNPLLQASVAKAWPDIEELLKAGLSLRDKSQARLAWDLEDGLHQRIAAVTAGEAAADASGGEEARDALERPIAGLLEDAGTRDYKVLPHGEAFLREIAPLEDENSRLRGELDAMGERYEELEKEIGTFGRRRQQYLRRVAQGGRRSKR